MHNYVSSLDLIALSDLGTLGMEIQLREKEEVHTSWYEDQVLNKNKLKLSMINSKEFKRGPQSLAVCSDVLDFQWGISQTKGLFSLLLSAMVMQD